MSVRPGRRRTVLVVEDYEPLRRLIGETLVDDGYEILDAGDLEQALGTASRSGETIDLAIVDLVLPGPTVHDFESEFARLQPGARLLAISGHDSSELERTGLLREGTAFLPKPFSAPQLLEAVSSALAAGT